MMNKEQLSTNIWPDQYRQKFNTRDGKEAYIKKGKPQGIEAPQSMTLEVFMQDSPVPVGFATLSFDTNCKHNFIIEVKPTGQKQGIGRKLFQTIVALARTSGIKMLVHTPVPHPPAELLDKWKMQKWIHLEEITGNKLTIYCSLNQRFT